jgi:pentatricopeptide repeat protein
MSVFGMILKPGLKPFNYTINSVLRELCISNEVDRDEHFYDAYISEMDHFGHEIMLSCLTKNGRFMLDVNLLQNLPYPDVIMLNTVMDALCKSFQVEEAYKLYLNTSSKHSIHGDGWTFNSLIHVHCFLNRLEITMTIYRKMPWNRVKPDLHTFGILTEGFSKHDRINETKFVINIMIKEGFKLDLISYTTLNGAYFDVNNVHEQNFYSSQ